MKKKLLRTALLLVLVGTAVFFPAAAGAENGQEPDPTQNILDEYAQLYGGNLNDGIDAMQEEELDTLVPGFDAEELMRDVMNGQVELSPGGILQWLFCILWSEVFAVGKLMLFVLVLSLLSSYLVHLQSGVGSTGVSQAAFFACYIMIAGIASAAFYEVVQYGQNAVENMAVFMHVLVPLVIGSLLSCGAIVSAAAFEPMLLAVVEITLTLIRNIFLPLVLLSAAANIVNGLSDKFNADKLVQLLNRFVKWGLCGMLTVFVSVAGIQSLSTAAADGLSVKVTKFAASNLIPVVGGILAESVETVMNCSVVLKNAVGITGMIVIAIIAVGPLLKIAASMIIFRLSAAIAEPVADSKIIKTVSSLADAVSMIFSMVAAVAVMFIIVLTIMVNVSNLAVFMGR